MAVNNKISNLIDLPLNFTDEESLDITKYVKAFSNFLRETQSPMTIAVQGEWGCGKTSMMNLIAGECCRNSQDLGIQASKNITYEDRPYVGVWINTWQYSLLKDDNAAQLAVIKGVARELSARMDGLIGGSSVVKEAGRKLISSLGGIALTAARVGVGAAGINPNSLDMLTDMVKMEQDGPEYFRRRFNESLDTYLQEINKDCKQREKIKGFIFFVDDLDRLDPPVAVQVLSLLKNLFEAKNCIFILAIDYEVVVQGLASRFGVKTTENEREFRSFFDKIIQLSFRVPTETYDISAFLRTLLGRIGFAQKWVNNDDFLKVLVDFVINSTGKNPRSIKRMLNTLSLVLRLHEIVPSELMQEDQGAYLKMLFAVVSVQCAYPKLYDEIIRKPNLYEWLAENDSEKLLVSSDELVREFEEELDADSFVLDDSLLRDPWMRKRERNIRRLLFGILRVVIECKKKNAVKAGLEQIPRTTKDILQQVLITSSMTAATLDEDEEEDRDFGNFDSFVTYWGSGESGREVVSEEVLANLRKFYEPFINMFDGSLIEEEFLNDYINILGKGARGGTKLVARIKLSPNGIVVASAGFKKNKQPRLVIGRGPIKGVRDAKYFDSVDESLGTYLKPIKDAYRLATGRAKCASTFKKAYRIYRGEEVSLEDALDDAVESPEDIENE